MSAAEKPSRRTSSAVADDLDTLGERDREILALERLWWQYAGAKEQAIREKFDMSSTRYYQVLNALIDRDDALAYDPLLVKSASTAESAAAAKPFRSTSGHRPLTPPPMVDHRRTLGRKAYVLPGWFLTLTAAACVIGLIGLGWVGFFGPDDSSPAASTVSPSPPRRPAPHRRRRRLPHRRRPRARHPSPSRSRRSIGSTSGSRCSTPPAPRASPNRSRPASTAAGWTVAGVGNWRTAPPRPPSTSRLATRPRRGCSRRISASMPSCPARAPCGPTGSR